ncbi:MAG TPA: hypothetical protein PLS10_02385 [Chitinophagales bacterium]|nr:hypothetical protein [Chitinophagales bacterium]
MREYIDPARAIVKSQLGGLGVAGLAGNAIQQNLPKFSFDIKEKS